jgi:hypothetical protein
LSAHTAIAGGEDQSSFCKALNSVQEEGVTVMKEEMDPLAEK